MDPSYLAVDTEYPAVDTLDCVSSLVTACPATDTVHPAVDTELPTVDSSVRMSSLVTVYPAVDTGYPAVVTVCPADAVSPAVDTGYPAVDTARPAECSSGCDAAPAVGMPATVSQSGLVRHCSLPRQTASQ